MSAVALGIAGAAVIGAVASSNAASSAASAETNASNNATTVEQNQQTQNQQNLQPWVDSGKAALGTLNSDLPNLTRGFTMADFQQDPGYAFQLQQGNQAIERSAAARGGLNSGATMKSLASYDQGLANTDYQQAFNNFNTTQGNTFNRLAGVAGVGQTAATTNATNGTATAANIGNNLTSAGNAQAAGSIAAGNNITSAIGTGMNTWLGNQMINRIGGTGSAGSGTGSTSNPTSGWNPQQLTMPQLGDY